MMKFIGSRTLRDDFFLKKWRTFGDGAHNVTIFSKKWQTYRDGGQNVTADIAGLNNDNSGIWFKMFYFCLN